MIRVFTLKTLGILAWIGLATVLGAYILGLAFFWKAALGTIFLNVAVFYWGKRILLFLGGKIYQKMDATHQAREQDQEIDLFALVNECLQEHPKIFSGMTTDSTDVYFIDSYAEINAFAVGWRGNAMVCITKGLIRQLRNAQGVLDREALKAIIFHELGHIRYDHTIHGLIAGLLMNCVLVAELPTKLNNTLAMRLYTLLIYPLGLLGSSLMRQREYEADDTARQCGHAAALKRGLAMMGEGNSWYSGYQNERRHWLVCTLELVMEFFSSHPHVKNRIAALDTEEREHAIAIQEHQRETQMGFLGFMWNRVKSNTYAVGRACREEFLSYKVHYTSDQKVIEARGIPTPNLPV